MRGKRIVVTGAASGVGAVLATELRAAGAQVFPTDRRAGEGIAICDLTDPDDIARYVRTLPEEIDGLACVAGVPGTLPAEIVLKVNYLGTRSLIDAVAPRLTDEAGIVVVSSLAGLRCTWPAEILDDLMDRSDWNDFLATPRIADLDSGTAYELSKRLIMAYAATLPRLLAPRRIRVNTVLPGPVETPILNDFRKSMGEDRIEAARAVVGRHATAREIAMPIAFLLSEAASWVNGITLPLDGGLGAMRAPSPAK